ncbi:MAG: hypothetical protein ACI4WV_07270 [Eubacteriales bacterium]
MKTDQKRFSHPHPYTSTVITRNENRKTLLDILEVEETVTRASLTAASGLGAMTIQRAVRLLMLEGILKEERRPDPNSGRMSRVLSPAPLPPAVVLDLSSRPYTAHLISDTCFHVTEEQDITPEPPAYMEVRETFTGEENLRLLLSRVRQILYPLLPTQPAPAGGNLSGLSRQERAARFRRDMESSCFLPCRGVRPVLILPTVSDSPRHSHTVRATPPNLPLPIAGPRPILESPARLAEVIREELDRPTLPGMQDVPVVGEVLVTDTRTAARYALAHSPVATDCHSLLCVLDREVPDVFFLLRDDADDDRTRTTPAWFTPACLAPMENSLARAILFSSTGGGWEQLLDLAAACARLIHPNGIYLDKEIMPPDVRQKLLAILPEDCLLFPEIYPRSLPLSVIGAAMMSRRRIWDDMVLEDSTDSTDNTDDAGNTAEGNRP